MKRVMNRITIISGVSTIAFFLLYDTMEKQYWFSLFVTAGTIFYHFAMRLLVGNAVRNHVRPNPHCRWFCLRPKEERFYQKIKIREWKNKLPTYVAEDFSFQKHSPQEIIQNMCISEVVHEVNMLLSFLPLAVSLFLPLLQEDWLIFAITGVLAAGVDLPFVLMQRYNRPRLLRLRAALERKR